MVKQQFQSSLATMILVCIPKSSLCSYLLANTIQLLSRLQTTLESNLETRPRPVDKPLLAMAIKLAIASTHSDRKYRVLNYDLYIASYH